MTLQKMGAIIMTTGQKIKKLRETNQLTQMQMAEKMHISANTYGRLERGETKMTENRLEQVAEIFNVDMAQILSTPEDKLILLVAESTWSDKSNVINYGSNDVELEQEIEKLKLSLNHKDEIIQEKEKMITKLEQEVVMLKDIIELLKLKLR